MPMRFWKLPNTVYRRLFAGYDFESYPAFGFRENDDCRGTEEKVL